LLIVVENDFSEKTACSVVHVDNDILEPSNRFKRSLDEIASGRSEDLDPDIIRNLVIVLQLSTECKIGV